MSSGVLTKHLMVYTSNAIAHTLNVTAAHPSRTADNGTAIAPHPSVTRSIDKFTPPNKIEHSQFIIQHSQFSLVNLHQTQSATNLDRATFLRGHLYKLLQ